MCCPPSKSKWKGLRLFYYKYEPAPLLAKPLLLQAVFAALLFYNKQVAVLGFGKITRNNSILHQFVDDIINRIGMSNDQHIAFVICITGIDDAADKS